MAIVVIVLASLRVESNSHFLADGQSEYFLTMSGVSGKPRQHSTRVGTAIPRIDARASCSGSLWKLGSSTTASARRPFNRPPHGSTCLQCRIRRMDWHDRISVNPTVRGGKPCVKGTRITVYDVLEYLAGGMSEDEILNDFPDLTREDIRASLAFAATRERRLAHSVA